MMQQVMIVALVAGLGFLLGRAAYVWLDSGRLGWPAGRRLGWSLWGAVRPSSYWWGARVKALPAEAQAALLARETRALGLSQAGSLRCPLCGEEVPHAWALDEAGRVTAAEGPVQCPGCDFRLDACRHCVHFMPGGPQSWYGGWDAVDGTWGRCGFYKRSQPVDDAAAPEMARSLKARGYDEIRAPMRIVDSMSRPDFCRAFKLAPKRLRNSLLRLPGPRRAALLRLLREQPPVDGEG